MAYLEVVVVFTPKAEKGQQRASMMLNFQVWLLVRPDEIAFHKANRAIFLYSRFLLFATFNLLFSRTFSLSSNSIDDDDLR